MNFYLPIYVNNRRMHIVQLEREAENRTLFSFIVNASDNYEVFSLPSKSIQLICDKGKNIDLKKVDYKMDTFASNDTDGRYRHCEGLPIYNVKISEGKGNFEVENSIQSCFQFSGNLGDTLDGKGIPFKLIAKYKSPRPHEYIIQFSYEYTDEFKQKSTFVGAVRICEYLKESEVFKASLDFGSEASQVHLSTSVNDANMNIRDAFIKIAKGDEEVDYWQGRCNEDKTLYKSIYHIHSEPAKTEFGDLPMNNKNKTFLQSLLPISADRKELILLPNLKLLEQLTDLLSVHTIVFKQDGFMGMVRNEEIRTDIKNKELRDGILRLILCNFLAVIMNSGAQKKFLHFILLVPNVYHQEKIHALITGLYDDFNLLRRKDSFSSYKGIEVSIVSESDASFFGIRSLVNRDTLPYIKNANYLIIDAGKGTTDFSLIAQRGKDLSNYCCLYRSGIPASGHVLTYAFYDALRNYFYKIGHGEFFDTIMINSVDKETSDVLNFVSLLEQFKIKYNELKENESIEKEVETLVKNNSSRTLMALNVFLQNKVLGKNLMIPGMKDALEEKITIMTSLIEDTIVTYAVNKGFTCKNVFLSGRAFKLDPFKEAVSTMLVEKGIVKSKDNIFYKEHLTKTMCTFGAMKAGEQSIVNMNSNMAGSPDLVEEFGDETDVQFDNKKNKYIQKAHQVGRKIRDKWRECRGVKKGVGLDISYDFFYEGLRLSNVKNAYFTLNGKGRLIGTGYKNDLYVYYIGNGYLEKHGDTCKLIDINGNISSISDEKLRKSIVKWSMFPFGLASFGLEDNTQIPKQEHDKTTGTNNNPDTSHNGNDEQKLDSSDMSDLNR